MHGFLAGLLLTATACSAPTTPPVLPPPTPLPDPPVAKVGFAVDPDRLGDVDIVKRIRHRTRLRRWGWASLRHDGEPIESSATATEELDYVMPVIDSTGAKIQIVIEEDHARYAVWIDPGDTWQTLVQRVRLDSTEQPEPPNEIGAFLDAGAPIETVPRTTRLRVRLRDAELVIEGFIDSTALGQIFIVPPGDPRPHRMVRWNSDEWTPRPTRPVRSLVASTPIRSSRSASGTPLAIPKVDIAVELVSEHGGWSQIEIVREYARVRGFVPTTTLGASPPDNSRIGTGGGSGFGMSHADRIEVPAGACLFDSVEGLVVGVQLDTYTRLGRKKTSHPSWSLVYINTPWDSTEFYVHETGGDPAQPVWESCSAP